MLSRSTARHTVSSESLICILPAGVFSKPVSAVSCLHFSKLASWVRLRLRSSTAMTQFQSWWHQLPWFHGLFPRIQSAAVKPNQTPFLRQGQRWPALPTHWAAFTSLHQKGEEIEPCTVCNISELVLKKIGESSLLMQLKVIVVPILHHGLREESRDDVILMFGLGQRILVCISE